MKRTTPKKREKEQRLFPVMLSSAQSAVFSEYLHRVADVANGQVWWSDPRYNEHGQLLSYLSGGSVRAKNQYDDVTHLLERIYVEDLSSNTLLDQRFQFDSLGNLTQRTKRAGTAGTLTENFTYDRLNRLLTAEVTGGDTVTMVYDDFGNITNRSSTGTLGHVGAYTYSADTNRVSTAGGRSYSYDANGSITGITTGSDTGTITWTAFNKPLHLATNELKRSSFSYDSANSRVAQTRQEWDPNVGEQGTWLDKTRKTYVGALFEQEQSNVDIVPGQIQWEIASTRIYISSPAGVVGSWVDDKSQTNPVKTVFHRDHLGSVVAHTDLAITPAEITREFSFDLWGLRRDASDWTDAPATPVNAKATDRGYTGHEMLDELGLVHMNGRIYDPLLGRMLSADPHIQSPTNLQNYNRYSYVTNNPLSMTDPSGFFFKKLFKSIAKFFKKFFKQIVAIAIAAFVTYFTFGLASAWGLSAYWSAVVAAGAGGFALGFTNTLLAGGSFSDALTAGIITGAIAAALTGFGLSGANLGDLNNDQYLELINRLNQYQKNAARIFNTADKLIDDGEPDNYKFENGSMSGAGEIPFGGTLKNFVVRDEVTGQVRHDGNLSAAENNYQRALIEYNRQVEEYWEYQRKYSHYIRQENRTKGLTVDQFGAFVHKGQMDPTRPLLVAGLTAGPFALAYGAAYAPAASAYIARGSQAVATTTRTVGQQAFSYRYAYQDVLIRGIQTSAFRNSYTAYQGTDFLYNVYGGDGVIPQTPLGVAGMFLNGALGFSQDDAHPLKEVFD